MIFHKPHRSSTISPNFSSVGWSGFTRLRHLRVSSWPVE